MTKTSNLEKNICRFGGVILTIYGVVGLVFELLANNFSFWIKEIWTIFNPFFVYYSTSGAISNMQSMSFFAQFSSTPLSIASLLYWIWPLGLIIIGVIFLLGT